jgi:hypothetical protein
MIKDDRSDGTEKMEPSLMPSQIWKGWLAPFHLTVLRLYDREGQCRKSSWSCQGQDTDWVEYRRGDRPEIQKVSRGMTDKNRIS